MRLELDQVCVIWMHLTKLSLVPEVLQDHSALLGNQRSCIQQCLV